MAQVVAHQAAFAAAQTQVVTISFGTAYWSQVWLQETDSPFPFLVDESLAAYRAYRLERSALRSWGVRNLLYYARARANGRATYGVRGDANQLGGDFVVDQNGRLALAHPSRDPTDRPTIEQLLKTVRDAQSR